MKRNKTQASRVASALGFFIPVGSRMKKAEKVPEGHCLKFFSTFDVLVLNFLGAAVA
jgi:hypothetical protein